MNKRFNTVNESKFNTLTNREMQSVKGGLCISCMKREKSWALGLFVTPSTPAKGTTKDRELQSSTIN